MIRWVVLMPRRRKSVAGSRRGPTGGTTPRRTLYLTSPPTWPLTRNQTSPFGRHGLQIVQTFEQPQAGMDRRGAEHVARQQRHHGLAHPQRIAVPHEQRPDRGAIDTVDEPGEPVSRGSRQPHNDGARGRPRPRLVQAGETHPRRRTRSASRAKTPEENTGSMKPYASPTIR